MNKLLLDGIIKTLPKKWTKEEECNAIAMRKNGINTYDIANELSRSQVSVAIKLKRLTKKNNIYNANHRSDKYKKNVEFLEIIKPKTILDLYASNSFYQNAFTNDIDEKFNTDVHMKAFNLLCSLIVLKETFDLIDLDPYGSAAEELPLAIKIANKGIIITIGEMGHKRWKRLDFVRKWWNINTMEDFTTQNIINNIIKIGERYRKQLTPVIISEYNLISRVYFKISPLKTLEQWGKNI